MFRSQLYVNAGAIGFGALVALAQVRGCPAGALTAERLPEVKRQLLGAGDLDALHHDVYARVGEIGWEDGVKRDFLQALTWETIRETGNLLPNEADVIDWVRKNPEAAGRMLREFGARRGRDAAR